MFVNQTQAENVYVMSCYTKDYQTYADNLIQSLMPFRETVSFGIDQYAPLPNWLYNCSKKAEWIAERAAELFKEGRTKVVFLDADCTVIQDPNRFYTDHPQAEIGVVWDRNLSTSVLFFRLTQEVVDLLNAWGKRCASDRNLPDNRVLENIWKDWPVKPSMAFLPSDLWCCPSNKRDGTKVPVIEHTRASRSTRENLNHLSFATNLEQLKGCLEGAHVVVAGCGPSTMMMESLAPYYWTIGVNDIGRFWHPDILVVVDSERSFTMQGRWHYINSTRAGLVVYNQDLPLKSLPHPAKCPVELSYPPREKGQVHIDKIRSLPCWRTSTLAAAVLAYQLGAKKIGLVGADYTPGHPSTSALKAIDTYFTSLREQLEQEGVELVQLSPITGMKSLELGKLSDFDTKEDWTKEILHAIAKQSERLDIPEGAV